MKDELVVIEAYYDSMSVVPYLAPGADTTSGIAALLELARVLSKPDYRPGRSVMFLATDGHFQGLAGMRAFMEGISRDVPGDMAQMRRDIYEDLRQFQELGRKIALSLDRRLLVDLPPSFFQKVNELTDSMGSLAAALSDLSSTQSEINWLVRAKRNEIERRKEKRGTARKREKQEFTPEEQARLETSLAKFRKDGIQTLHFLEDVVEKLDQLKTQAISECRKTERQIIEEIAIPMAQLDVKAVEKLIEGVRSGKIKHYDRYSYLYSEDEIRKLGLKLEDWEVTKMMRQYSYEKLLDRHLSPNELIRLKKARDTLAGAEKGKNYEDEERMLLQKAYKTAKASKPESIIQKVSRIASLPPKKRFSGDELRTLKVYLSNEDFTSLLSTKKSLIKGEGSEERLIGELGRLMKIAERNAELELPRLKLLAESATKINREFTDDEKRALRHYLSQKDYDDLIAAHAQLFSRYEENRLLDLVRSRAKNDIIELQNLYNQIDSITSFTNDQKALLRDNLLTLRNSRIRNIQKKVEVLSRMNRQEYERKIAAMLQAIELQYTMNRYYT
ncbi:TPA: M28 family peptidase, partial [Candidatus Poribacteria bacterium]|nr:M28 family peptidase [Candidatus Poribacteria bacterium]HEX29052.1 M28 family peptidase [Candidatus Poribacteria bacterium]